MELLLHGREVHGRKCAIIFLVIVRVKEFGGSNVNLIFRPSILHKTALSTTGGLKRLLNILMCKVINRLAPDYTFKLFDIANKS